MLECHSQVKQPLFITKNQIYHQFLEQRTCPMIFTESNVTYTLK